MRNTVRDLVPGSCHSARRDWAAAQANVYVMMLIFSVGFYYSKSLNCCEEKKAFLGCIADRSSECIG